MLTLWGVGIGISQSDTRSLRPVAQDYTQSMACMTFVQGLAICGFRSASPLYFESFSAFGAGVGEGSRRSSRGLTFSTAAIRSTVSSVMLRSPFSTPLK